MKKIVLLVVGALLVVAIGGVIAWTPSTEAAPPSCESKCDKQYQKCLRQGNDPGFCYDLVFCECMCNVCDNCVC